MYFQLIYPLVIVLYLVLNFLNKRGLFKRIRLWLRRQSYYHSKVFIQIRYWVKVFTPHMWSMSAYKLENWKKFPAFYSVLNGLQAAFIFGGAIILVGASLSLWKISAVEQDNFIEYKAVIIDFIEPYRDSRDRYVPGRLKVLLINKQKITFVLHGSFLKKHEGSLQQMNRLKGGENVVLKYFSILGIDYLLSLKHSENTYVEKSKSIDAYKSKNAYRSMKLGQHFPLEGYYTMIILGLLLGLLKYKMYGLRNYFNRIKS